ncbi:EAL domain-containing protein [Solirubrobacter phytolaccae]|uniref:EAL domain-containing protein n=1 Tax=Solirubrobacter phytolaccae TaxID=1404360 RepID=A0A9X3NAH2_9ACTN|nr:EAL domain-containing protein [Solirubrobacter phytolaccae]MDA0181464.1 EAL domain-containing protein [Solirubrobacter phytolaccae]
MAVPEWRTAVPAVLDQPERIRPVFQPIFDLQRGVVCGFEMLARFDSELQAAPDKWFAAAAQLGIGHQLEAALIARGLEARHRLPENCFLAVNVGPDALLSDTVGAVLAGQDLSRIVVEVTEAAPVEDYDALLRALSVLRDAGAMIAVDDAGAGYASLNHVMQIRPDFVKLDRALVMDVDRDPAKHALVETFGVLAGRLDAWLLAEGIERDGEREVLAAMGVPLAQGFGLGRPAADMHAGLRVPGAPAAPDALSALLCTAFPVLGDGEHPPAGSEAAVVVDRLLRPAALLTQGREVRLPMTALVTDQPADVAQRALTRTSVERFDPICCIDERGRLIGLLPFEQLVRHLASTERTHP